jgi:lysozyme-like predicted toxin
MARLHLLSKTISSSGRRNQFNAAQKFGNFTFGQLPGNTQTMIVDMSWHYGSLPIEASVLWSQVTSGDWGGAVANLASFGNARATNRNQANAGLVTQDINAGLLPHGWH